MTKIAEELRAAFRSRAPSKIEWLIAGTVLGIFFFSHIYWDMIVTTRHGINVWDSLFSGRLFDFYHDNTAPPMYRFTTTPAIYPFPVYIIFALWNFPLWLLERFADVNPLGSALTLMYAKSVLIPFLIGSTVLIRKICLKLAVSPDNASWCSFFFFTGITVTASLGIIGQYDIFGVFFMLMGLYFYVDKKYKKFVIFFAIAITMKLFALIVFIPLLLLAEKRIWHIALRLFGATSLYIVCSALFPLPEEALFFINAITGVVFLHRLPLTYMMHTPIFVTMTILLWIFCYTRNKKASDREKGIMGVYAAFLSMAILLVTCYTHVYWIIIMAPFMCILCFIHERKHTKAIWLTEMMMCGSFIIPTLLTNLPFFGVHTINDAWPGTLFGETQELTGFGTLLGMRIGENMLMNIAHSFAAAFIAGIIAFAVMTYPRKQELQAIPESGESAESSEISEISELSEIFGLSEEKTEQVPQIKVHRSMIWGRIALNTAICAIPLILYIYYILGGEVNV
jgi:hypothetical protein